LRLTRDEIAASNNLLYFHPSAIVASFSDIWRLDFFGAIWKVTSLFSRICSGAEKSKEDRRRNLTQEGYEKGQQAREDENTDRISADQINRKMAFLELLGKPKVT